MVVCTSSLYPKELRSCIITTWMNTDSCRPTIQTGVYQLTHIFYEITLL